MNGRGRFLLRNFSIGIFLCLISFLSACKIDVAKGPSGVDPSNPSALQNSQADSIPHGPGLQNNIERNGSGADALNVGGDGTPIEGKTVFLITGTQINPSIDQKETIVSTESEKGVKLPYFQNFEQILTHEELGNDFKVQLGMNTNLKLNDSKTIVSNNTLVNGEIGRYLSLQNLTGVDPNGYARVMLTYRSLQERDTGAILSFSLRHINKKVAANAKQFLTSASATNLHLNDGRAVAQLRCESKGGMEACDFLVRDDACLMFKERCRANGEDFTSVGKINGLSFAVSKKVQISLNLAANQSGAGTATVQIEGATSSIQWRWSEAFEDLIIGNSGQGGGPLLGTGMPKHYLNTLSLGTMPGVVGEVHFDNIEVKRFPKLLDFEEFERRCPRSLMEEASDLSRGENERMIRYSYCLFLGRGPTPNEITKRINEISENKFGINAFFLELFKDNSWLLYMAANRKTPIDFLLLSYRRLLQRDPDFTSIVDSNRLANLDLLKDAPASYRAKQEEIILEIINSDEFKAKHGTYVKITAGK